MWVIFIPFLLIPVFLVLLGRTLQRPSIAVSSAA